MYRALSLRRCPLQDRRQRRLLARGGCKAPIEVEGSAVARHAGYAHAMRASRQRSVDIDGVRSRSGLSQCSVAHAISIKPHAQTIHHHLTVERKAHDVDLFVHLTQRPARNEIYATLRLR